MSFHQHAECLHQGKIGDAVEALTQNSNAMGIWMSSNKLQLRPNKKELLLIKKIIWFSVSVLSLDGWHFPEEASP